MSRKLAREIGMQILYQLDFHPETKQEQIDIFLDDIIKGKNHNDKPLKKISEQDLEYTRQIVNGTITELEIVDQKIAELAKGWTLDRIAKVDLAILRFAIYEILFRADIPNEVSINEAVELAKKYSTDDSKAFINGILGKVVK